MAISDSEQSRSEAETEVMNVRVHRTCCKRPRNALSWAPPVHKSAVGKL